VYNNGVRPFRTLWLLALVAILSAAFVPAALATWVCEGRACGTSWLACCCASPQAGRDANCGSGPAVEGAAARCLTECNCVLTVTSQDTVRGRLDPGSSIPLELPCLLQGPLLDTPSVPAERLLRTAETRGPPLLAYWLAAPDLRGPPALIPSIGS
jgi:hypothetical protein